MARDRQRRRLRRVATEGEITMFGKKKKQIESLTKTLINHNQAMADLFINFSTAVTMLEYIVTQPMSGTKAAIQKDIRELRLRVERYSVQFQQMGLVNRVEAPKPEESRILAPTPENIRPLVALK
jgi:hypothetical protein